MSQLKKKILKTTLIVVVFSSLFDADKKMFLFRSSCGVLNKAQLWSQSRKLFVLQKSSSKVVLQNVAFYSSRVTCKSINYHYRTLVNSHHNRIHESSTACCKQTVDQNNDEKQRSWTMMKYGFIFFGLWVVVVCVTVVYEINKPVYDEEGNLVQDEYSSMPFFHRVYYRLKREVSYYKKMVQEPSREKLLPDPLKHPYIQPPYTVVLELTDVLVHPDWTYQTGWRFKKRPGIDQFLEAIAPPQFETVVYTAEQGLTVFPIIDALDPQGYIMYRLVRDATRFVDGHHVKDLDSLNRDLSKVIVIDWNSDSVKFNPDNMLKIPRWNGNDNDTTLYDLAAFLKTIYQTNVDDVRDVLNYYSQFDNPLETFRENRRKVLMQMEEEEHKNIKEDKTLASKWTPSFLRK